MAKAAAHKPRTKPAGERRDELMDAAQVLFLRQGVEATTIEEITQGAGVAKGSFYLQFGSKADVVEALRARFVEGVLAAIVAAVGRCGPDDWRGRLTAWCDACAAGYIEAADMHSLVFSAGPPAPRAGLARNSLVEHLGELLADGVGAGAWAVGDPGFTAVFLFNALHGVVNAGGPEDARGMLRALEAHFLRMVGLVG